MTPITAIVLGAGNRGSVYTSYAKDHGDEFSVVAIADPRRDRLDALADSVGVSAENRFDSWQTLLAQPKMADVAIICTQDDDHTAPAIKALELGYHVLLEKPMSNSEVRARVQLRLPAPLQRRQYARGRTRALPGQLPPCRELPLLRPQDLHGHDQDRLACRCSHHRPQ